MANNHPIKKAIIPIAGLGTRFLPLSKSLPKELFPLVDIPMIQYIVEEVIKSGIKEIIFITRPEKKSIFEYFKTGEKTEKVLKAKYKDYFVKEVGKLEKLLKNVSFSEVIQKEPLGDGHAVLQAKKIIGKESFAVLYSDDIVESKTPCLSQLMKVFKKYRKPVIALHKVPKQSFKFYGMVKGEKIDNRTYKVKEIVEKPSIENSPSDLAIVGKYILTPEVFDYLEKNFVSERGEIGLTETLGEMVKAGKEIYGYEFEGNWLECGNKLAYLKTNLYLSLKHTYFGKELKKFLKNN